MSDTPMKPEWNRILAQYGENTFTSEFSPREDAALYEMREAGLVDRHPGIFGSHRSWYRTEKGMRAWARVVGRK